MHYFSECCGASEPCNQAPRPVTEILRAYAEAMMPRDADGEMLCLYGEDVLCAGHCDCGWGSMSAMFVLDVLDGRTR